MSQYNFTLIEGRLTRDPELVFKRNGGKFAKFAIANNESFFNDQGQEIKTTVFKDVAANGVTMDIAMRLKKGQPVLIQGKTTQNIVKNEDGTSRTYDGVTAFRIWELAENRRPQTQGATGSAFADEEPQPKAEEPAAPPPAPPKRGGRGNSNKPKDAEPVTNGVAGGDKSKEDEIPF